MIDYKELFKPNDHNDLKFSDLIQKRRLFISNGVIKEKVNYSMSKTRYFKTPLQTLPFLPTSINFYDNSRPNLFKAENKAFKQHNSNNFQDLLSITKIKVNEKNFNNELISAKINKKIKVIKLTQTQAQVKEGSVHELRNVDLLKLSINFNKVPPLKLQNKETQMSFKKK